MNGRTLRPLALLLTAFTLGLAGCTGGDQDEYRAYSPVDDGPDVTQPVTDVEPDAETEAIDHAAVAVEAASPDDAEDPAAEPVDTADAPAENTPGTTETPAIATERPAGAPGLALTPEQQAELDAIAASAAAQPAEPAEPRETKLLIPEKTFRTEGPEGALRVSYDDLDLLKVLNMEPVTATAPEHFPSWLKDLDGKRIRLRGYMRPDVLAEDLPFFILARDTQACCFGPNTKAYDIIPTIMREGVTTDYIHLQPFDIVGNFHINVEMDLDDPNKVEFLYYIDDAVLVRK